MTIRFLALLGLLLLAPSVAAEGTESEPNAAPPADAAPGQGNTTTPSQGNVTHPDPGNGQGNATCHGDGAKRCDGNFTREDDPELAYVFYVNFDLANPESTSVSGTYTEESSGRTATTSSSEGVMTTRIEIPDTPIPSCEPWLGVTPFGSPPYTFRPECLLL